MTAILETRHQPYEPVVDLRHDTITTDFSTSDSAYWWQSTGKPLREMLAFAGYSPARNEFYLNFYRELICPAMGPPPSDCPMRYRGCLTSDGTPIEYSFSFDGSTSAPEVRFSIDPVAATGDLLSVSHTLEILFKLCSLAEARDLDLRSWAAQLFETFLLPSTIDRDHTEDLVLQAGHKSQVMLGFDLSRATNAIGAKIYFLPCLKAAFTGSTRWQVVHDAILQLTAISTPSVRASLLPQVVMLRDHIARYPKRLENNVRYLSVDLVQQEKARIKVYVRAPGESFNDIWDFMTMHDRIPYSAHDRRAIQELYALVRGGGDELDPSSAQPRQNRLAQQYMKTAAPFAKSHICYFVLGNGYKVPRSKLFIRAQKPFAHSDLTVAQALERWFKRWDWLQDDFSWHYTDALKAAFPHRDFDDDGLHCWVAISIKKGKLTVESYLTPELYKGQEAKSGGTS